MSIRAVRQTPYKKYNGTAPTERTDTVIPYRIAHVYVLESGLNFGHVKKDGVLSFVCSIRNSNEKVIPGVAAKWLGPGVTM